MTYRIWVSMRMCAYVYMGVSERSSDTFSCMHVRVLCMHVCVYMTIDMHMHVIINKEEVV